MRFFSCAVVFAALLSLAACDSPKSADRAATPELLVYSSRIEQLIKPIFDKFTAQTGIRIRYVTDSAGPLLARLKAEGSNSKADIFMTVDAGNLWQAAELGVLQSTPSTLLQENIPAALRDAESRWFGLSLRARTIVYASDRVSPEELSSYAALADPKWDGRLCLRTAKKVYNQSLVATMIAAHGESETERVVTAWVNNLAVAPFSSDVKVIEAIAAEQCDVGLVNTYYLARELTKNPDLPVALFWANQRGEGVSARGVHVNISGAGITAASKHKAEALQLIEWLSGPQAQYEFANLNQEFPVNKNTAASEQSKLWGEFVADNVAISEAGRLQAQAIRLMDRAGYR